MVAAIEPLLLTEKEAANRLTISPRMLWTLANEGQIPRVQIGRIVRYDPADLIAFKESRKTLVDTPSIC